MNTLSVQVMSDLHPKYSDLDVPVTAPYLAFLGNVGQVDRRRIFLHREIDIFTFFENQLRRYEIVFFVLGVRETQDMDYNTAKETIRAFETRINEQPGLGKFVYLDQTRYDISPDTTVLGCTLHSHISAESKPSIEEFWQFSVGNRERSIDDHNAGHDSDVAWLNQQVAHMAAHEPHRKVVIFTHHSPTVDRRATTIPLPHWSEVSTTDLSKEVCWTSPTVRMWAFACIQVNCDLTLDGKKLVTNKQVGVRADEFDPGKSWSLSFLD
ncbi:uncharacterized protein LDX57_003852 [Aspergillus melleus]|uniref:uncharacterized protein n=1 Tax=Aspergillus melleus TaxID=138277 RepID=UPI001E8EB108|nr:uncharacterized protein LDX57_003852 [Aspergillus melleus]KAH8426110.1 hypothetical protein LDX57_003852 [Aspergillus melleus]